MEKVKNSINCEYYHFKPATQEELSTKIGIIYLIINKINNMCYVGQTRFSFYERYNKKFSTHNKILQRAINKYGMDIFQISLLEEGFDNTNDLNNLEEYWARKLNCYYPNGYNLTECGENKKMSQQTKDFLSKNNHNNRKKPIFLKEIKSDNIIEIWSLSKWCKENNINRGNLIKMIYDKTGGHLESQGYCLPETSFKDLKGIKRNKYEYDEIELEHESGITEKIKIADFCKKYNIRRKYISNLIRGRTNNVFGWHLKGKMLQKFKYCNLIFLKEGKEIFVSNLPEFAKNNNYDYSSLIKLIKGKIKFHKGLTFKTNI